MLDFHLKKNRLSSRVTTITFLGFVAGLLLLTIAFIIKFWGLSNYAPGKEFLEYCLEDKLFVMVSTSPLLLAISGYFTAKYIEKSFVKILSERDAHIEIVRRTANFAREIGLGNFSVDFVPFNDEDELGKALLLMRDNLVNKAKEEENRKWIISGIAEAGDILRRNNNLKSLADELLVYLTKKIDAVQAAFYIAEEDCHGVVWLNIISTYAYNRKKFLSAKFKIGQGLVGQSVIERDLLYRTEIPDDYVTIKSGILGEQKPKALMITPLITNEKVFGAIEFAGIHKFTKVHIDFVREVSEIIARTIFNISVNENTLRMLNEAQEMSSMLELQKTQLLENAEKMKLAQEELKRSNELLEIKIKEVNNAQKRLYVLLERASEIISIYEPDGTVRYESPSIINILGYHPDELIGKNDKSRFYSEDIEVFDLNFARVLKNPNQPVKFQFRYIRNDEKLIWMEATLSNLLGDPAIKGIIMNSRDITSQKEAEAEQKERAKMQALSENSPDLITRVDIHGNISYVNPVIKIFNGSRPTDLMHKRLSQVNLPEKLIDLWHESLNQVKSSKLKYFKEISLSTSEGPRIFEVKAIPELDEMGRLESVLIIAHDVTEQKKIEHEIKESNKKINDSINYAERIQRSILPQEQHIYNYFSDCMMLFVPRDKVSGDFPWFYLKDDNIFVSVVDCTGHGVPGALMSLIGHFLLNETISYENINSPSVLLDYLHEGVVRALKQKENKDTRDGMDVAMCMININKNLLNFSGAHRPLLLLRDGEIIEYKPDRRPIGGVQYNADKPFTNHQFEIKKGDAVFIYSDGLPDQIGGPEKKKFSNNRIKELIIQNKDLPMDSIRTVFLEEFNKWKGDAKQIDDVLLIGIRL